jgi:gliding motility-associated-like protein
MPDIFKNMILRRLLFVLIFIKTLHGFGQTTPPHYYHNPPNCGVNNLFFNSGVCNKFQFIYTQAEIATMTTPVTGSISISRIWFRHGGGSSDPSTTLSNLEIKMGHTTLTNPAGQFNSNFNAGTPVTVLTSASYIYTPLIGAAGVSSDNWTFIDLQTPFTYNFSDNICIELSFSNSSGYIVGHFADNGGIPISQYAGSNSATNADGSTARPVFGISAGSAPCPPVTVTTSQTNVSCNGAADGSATVVASGGTSFTYAWSPSGGSNSTASGLEAGTYTCTITNECGNSTTQSFTITEPDVYQLNATVVQPTCGNNNGCIYFDPTPAGTYFYDWPFPTVMIVDSLCDLALGSYEITITNIDGCTVDTTILLTDNSTLQIDASPENSTIDLGDSIQLNAIGGDSYSWNPSTGLSCSDCPDPLAAPTENTTYIVTGTDANGCSGSDTVFITVLPEPVKCADVYVPTVFSPNGNGNAANKMICVYGGCITEINFEIYNRWGEKVFETNDVTLSECWDGTFKGKPLNSGSFVYKLIVTLTTNETIEKSGNIVLIR